MANELLLNFSISVSPYFLRWYNHIWESRLCGHAFSPTISIPVSNTDFQLQQTWLAAGACAQSILFLTIPRHVALLPALILLLLRFAKGFLITQGLIHNTYMDGAFMHKSTAPILNDDGSIPSKAAHKGLVVFIVGANSNQ